jgi:hypothetical protein
VGRGVPREKEMVATASGRTAGEGSGEEPEKQIMNSFGVEKNDYIP